MAAKDFGTIDTMAKRTGDDSAKQLAAGKKRQGRQPEITPQEKREREENLQTRGKKGCSGPKVFLTISPSNYEFLTRMARAHAMPLNKYCNRIFDQYREEHQDIYRKICRLIDEIDAEGADKK